MKITKLKLAKALALTDRNIFTKKLKNVIWQDILFYKKLGYIGEAQRVIKALEWLKKNENKRDGKDI